MKKYLFISIIILLTSVFYSCEDSWVDHYGNTPETSDQSVWETIKNESNLSKFVELVEKYKLDSIFNYNDVYTLFVPSNKAIENYSNELTEEVVAYHIMKYYLQPKNVSGVKKVQTILLKFAQFENRNEELFYDNIPITYTSPLFQNGRYFLIDEVSSPKLNLYEYISLNNLALKKYIDDQDSIVLDKELSTPIGFDEFGNTVYDSIIDVINLFEEEYFQVSEEFRLKTATLVFPKQNIYNEALTEMALKIGSGYNSYTDIAEEWQQDILIPYLLETGVFENQLTESEFLKDTLLNIIGDKIFIDYRPADLTYCSNGYAYNYAKFTIADSLFLNALRLEGESLLKFKGQNTYVWNEDVSVTSDQVFKPNSDYVNTASNDSILRVEFPTGYEGEYNLEFNSEPLFPRRYLFVVRTNMDFGGIYDIYINDEFVRTFDYADYLKQKGIISSSVEGIRFIPDGRFNKFDFWVENITEYGKARIRFEYKGPSKARYNGLMIDYISFVPEDKTDLITTNP